jgi:hypothetical protein
MQAGLPEASHSYTRLPLRCRLMCGGFPYEYPAVPLAACGGLAASHNMVGWPTRRAPGANVPVHSPQGIMLPDAPGCKGAASRAVAYMLTCAQQCPSQYVFEELGLAQMLTLLC